MSEGREEKTPGQEKSSLDNKFRPDKTYGILEMSNEGKMPTIIEKEKPTVSRKTLQEHRDFAMALSHLGGDDGTKVTLPQIKRYLETVLRFMEVSNVPDKTLKDAQLAQDLTSERGKSAALGIVIDFWNYFNEIRNQLRDGQVDKFQEAVSVGLVTRKEEIGRTTTALFLSMSFLSPSKASS